VRGPWPLPATQIIDPDRGEGVRWSEAENHPIEE
jgi:hypothetical protein